MIPKIENIKIATVGLGYVGLPLSLLLAKKYSVSGFDISEKRIEQLRDHVDLTREATAEELRETNMTFSNDEKVISESNVIIVTVPTPIDQYKKPELTPITSATKTVAKNLKKGSIVVDEIGVSSGFLY